MKKIIHLKTTSIEIDQICMSELNADSDGVLYAFGGKYPMELIRSTLSNGVIRYEVVTHKSCGLYLNLEEAVDMINSIQLHAYLYPSYRYGYKRLRNCLPVINHKEGLSEHEKKIAALLGE